MLARDSGRRLSLSVDGKRCSCPIRQCGSSATTSPGYEGIYKGTAEFTVSWGDLCARTPGMLDMFVQACLIEMKYMEGELAPHDVLGCNHRYNRMTYLIGVRSRTFNEQDLSNSASFFPSQWALQ